MIRHGERCGIARPALPIGAGLHVRRRPDKSASVRNNSDSWRSVILLRGRGHRRRDQSFPGKMAGGAVCIIGGVAAPGTNEVN